MSILVTGTFSTFKPRKVPCLGRSRITDKVGEGRCPATAQPAPGNLRRWFRVGWKPR